MPTDRAEQVILAPVEPASPWVEAVRRRFDPLASVVPPHLTLVFPFESELSPEDVAAHMAAALAGVAAFEVTLDGLTGAEESYLFHTVKRGNDELIELHDRLYSGPLAAHLDATRPYLPHVTVGRVTPVAAWRAALEELVGSAPRSTMTVRRVVSYRRWPDGSTRPDNSVHLAG